MSEDLCLCLAVVARQQEPESYKWCGKVLWGLWQVCPIHHKQFAGPVWHPRLGQLKYEETAPAYEAEAVAVRN